MAKKYVWLSYNFFNEKCKDYIVCKYVRLGETKRDLENR